MYGMMKLVVCLLALTVVTSAYNFKDSDFNEYLFDELQSDYYDSLDGPTRNRREAQVEAPNDIKECARRDWKKDIHCCSGDKFNREKVEIFKELKKQCLSEVRGNEEDTFDPFDCEKMQEVKRQMTCVSECVAKKLGAFDENGELKRDALLEQLRKKIDDNQWKKDAVEAYVDKCIAEVKQSKAKDASKEAKGCNSDALQFHHCMWREFSNGCPADLRVNSPRCDKMRERLAKGDTSFLNKHFLHQYHHSRKGEEE